ncbi:uncharacterized protein LOC114267576 [Camellia sinensis]|uniref:uncharacterized protein LOC114267576 n=1 Tax=Camellia sinensis TaxID=4442 RepID=UPI001035C231|nr:uncharacterized protein LOC114267576 [Camellia sinensis]
MIGPPDTRCRDRRCEYHKDHGHYTDSCYALKDNLEDLVQDDRLAQHVRKGNPPNTTTLQPNSPLLGLIHMIYSLPPPTQVHTIQIQPSLSKSFKLAKRCHKTEQISFDDTDLKGVTLPYNDAHVIELHVSRFTVERVVIDQGSTSEIMYYKTFLKLSFTELDLLPTEYPLFGFNANPEYPLEKITVSVRAGTRSVDAEFVVVKLSSLYNLIMGRT